MSIFNGTFKPFVISQLKARQALLSTEGNRPINVQMYASAKTAWVKMSSFVDYTDDMNKAPDSTLAKKYVLEGGTLIPSTTSDTDFAMRAGVGNRNGSYGSNLGNRQLGLRPMPGIESVQVVNKGAYGSLRLTTVKFHCWDKAQLDDLEILYMRTGYPVLVEWGWSVYIDTSDTTDKDAKAKSNNGHLDPDVSPYLSRPIKSFTDPVINPFDSSKDLNAIYDDIQRLNHKFSGNYDGMVGIIQNFTWELLPNGSYACTTIIVSMGDTLDSIKMNRPSIEKEAQKQSEGYKTSFTSLMYRLTAHLDKDRKQVTPILGDLVTIEDVPGIDVHPFHLEKYANAITTAESVYTYPTYIQLGFFVAILNKYFSLLDSGSPMINIEVPLPDIAGNKGNGLCLGSVDSVSINPFVCVINNSQASWITGLKEGCIVVPGNKEFLYDKENKNFRRLGVIGNIYLNVQHLTEIFNNMIASDPKGEVHMYTYLRKVMSDVANSLGSVNDFDVYVEDSKAIIIDKNYTEVSEESDRKKKFQMNIFGTDSVVRGFKIVSKVFQSQVNMMAIAAGGRLNLGGVNNSTQYYFNKGLKNRLSQGITTAERDRVGEDEHAAKLAAAASVLELRRYLQEFLVKSTTHNNSFPGQGESIASANTILNSTLLQVNSDVNYRSIIPINVELTLDGIAGITIGEVFTLNTDMLPKEYDRKDLGFMVTSIQQNITKSDWTTTIGAYVVLLNQEENQIAPGKYAKNSLENSLTPAQKNDMNALIKEVIGGMRGDQNDYYLKYRMLLSFIKEYYANNLYVDVRLEFKPPARPKTVFGHLVRANPTTHLEFLLAEASNPDEKGKYLDEKYDFRNNPHYHDIELPKATAPILNPLIWNTITTNAYDNPKVKDMLKYMVSKSSDYAVLINKAPELRKNIDDIIDDVWTIAFHDSKPSFTDVKDSPRAKTAAVVPAVVKAENVEVHGSRLKVKILAPVVDETTAKVTYPASADTIEIEYTKEVK